MLSAFMLSAFMLSAFMLTVVKLTVGMLNVVAPSFAIGGDCYKTFCSNLHF